LTSGRRGRLEGAGEDVTQKSWYLLGNVVANIGFLSSLLGIIECLMREFSVKIYKNTFVLIWLTLSLTLSVIGCKGTGSASSPTGSFATGSLTRSGQSSEVSTPGDSGRSKIDFNTAADGSSKVALASYVSGNKDGEPQWLDSYEDALQLSKQTGRPILADFTGSNWCPPCKRLKQEIFETPQFKSWAAENVVLLELDFPRPNLQPDWIKKQNQDLSRRYEIRSYPTVLILNSEGQVLGSQGYMRGGPARWIAVADNHIQANQALQTSRVVDAADYQSR